MYYLDEMEHWLGGKRWVRMVKAVVETVVFAGLSC